MRKYIEGFQKEQKALDGKILNEVIELMASVGLSDIDLAEHDGDAVCVWYTIGIDNHLVSQRIRRLSLRGGNLYGMVSDEWVQDADDIDTYKLDECEGCDFVTLYECVYEITSSHKFANASDVDKILEFYIEGNEYLTNVFVSEKSDTRLVATAEYNNRAEYLLRFLYDKENGLDSITVYCGDEEMPVEMFDAYNMVLNSICELKMYKCKDVTRCIMDIDDFTMLAYDHD